MARITRSVGFKTKRLLQEARVKEGELEAARSNQAVARAMTHLTDAQLYLIRDAVQREGSFDSEAMERYSPEEREAFTRFLKFYEEETEAGGGGA